MSDDGQYGLVVIAFIGSVFSPYYRAARVKGAADPNQFCAINVSLRGPRAHRWAFTERSAGVSRDSSSFTLGNSSLRWDGDTLVVQFDEATVPWPGRVKGQLRLTPALMPATEALLDAHGRHRWQPVAPCAHAEVTLTQPALKFSGTAYHDINHGDEPLEAAFRGWHWARGSGPTPTVTYDVVTREGQRRELALGFAAAGTSELEMTEHADLAPSWWGIARRARGHTKPTLVRTLEDTPFYARSVISADGVSAIHESLDLDKFVSPSVQFMLPWKIRRERG